MELLTRLQPLDYILALVWAAVVAIGVRTGVVRQVIFLVAGYLATIAASQLYRPLGTALSNFGFGPGAIGILQWFSYPLVLAIVFFAITILSKRMYSHTALANRRRVDALLGGLVGALVGIMLLIQVVVTIAFYGVTPPTSASDASPHADAMFQVQRSQVAAVLRVGLSPFWNAMEPWFPDRLRG